MNFKLNPRLSIYFSFGLVIFLVLLIVYFSLTETSHDGNSMQSMVKNNSDKNTIYSEMMFHSAQHSLHLHSMFLTPSQDKRNKLYIKLKEHDGQFLKLQKKLQSLLLDKKEKELLSLQQSYFIIEAEQNKAAKLLLEGKDEQAKRIILNITPSQDKAQENLNNISRYLNHQNIHNHDTSAKQMGRTRNITLLLTLLAILIILIIAWIVYQDTQHFITTLKTSFKKVKNSEIQERNIRELMIDSVIIIDHQGLIIEFNKAAEKDFEYTKDEIIGQSINLLMTSADMSHHDKYMNNYINSGNSKIIGMGREVIVKRKDGTTFFADISVSKIDNDDGPPCFMGTIHNVTERKENELQLIQRHTELEQRVKKRTEELANANTLLSQQANFDALTGLANRYLFFDRLRQAIAQAKRHNYKLAILFVDLDGFKNINDSYGHSTGDKVLKKIARRMQQCLRDEDTVSRIGGDEFAIILNEVNETSTINMVTEKVINTINQPLNITDKNDPVGASIGISIYPDNNISPEELLKQADIAMYISKDKGKNTFTLYENTNS